MTPPPTPGQDPGRPVATPPRRGGRWSDRKREMYAGGRPNAEAKAIHRRYVAGPIPRLVPTACVLETRGRHSGRTIEVPLVIVRWRGDWYVAAMLGPDTNWVRNVRAAGGDAMLIHGRRRAVHLVEVPADRRAGILKRYLLFAPGARPHVPVGWNDPLEAFERVADRIPVFRVDPA